MTEREQYLSWLLGNEEATHMILALGEISQLWDDCVDQDKPVNPAHAHWAFLQAMVFLPRNSFYREHFDELQPVIEMVILDWVSANSLEKTGDRHNLSLAHVLRDSLAAVVIRAMALVGGFQYAAEHAAEVRAYVHDEPLEEYLKGKVHERQE